MCGVYLSWYLIMYLIFLKEGGEKFQNSLRQSHPHASLTRLEATTGYTSAE